MEAPCIVDPGASDGVQARPVTTASLGLQLSWLPWVRVSSLLNSHNSLLFVATCLKVSGVQTSDTPNVTPPLLFLVVSGGEAEQIS